MKNKINSPIPVQQNIFLGLENYRFSSSFKIMDFEDKKINFAVRTCALPAGI